MLYNYIDIISIIMYVYVESVLYNNIIHNDAIQLIHRVGSAQHHLKERLNNN